jgi:hypothetical protein
MCRVGVQSAMDAYQRLTTLAALRTQTEAADEYMCVVRTTLAPHPPRYLPHPFAVHIFAKKQHHVHSGRPGVGANATGMHSQRGRVVLLDVVKKTLQPISTRRPIPAAYVAAGCLLPSGVLTTTSSLARTGVFKPPKKSWATSSGLTGPLHKDFRRD